MALHELRAEWHLDDSTDFGGALAEVWATKISLEPGKKHTIHAVDMFIDTLNCFVSGVDPISARIMGQVFLSAYPAWDYALLQEFGATGPYASDPSVLYKAAFEFLAEPNDVVGPGSYTTTLTKLREFPQDTIAAAESFDVYSNQLYMTVIIMRGSADTFISDSHISMLIQVDDKEVDEIEHFMGAYAEMLEAQRKRLLMESMPRGDNYSGYWFPSANFGGIRPERMVNGNLIQAFLTSGADNAEQMLTQSQYKDLDEEARKMQAYNEAFGGTVPLTIPGPSGEVPDWLRFVRSEQFMMQERDVFPARVVDPTTMAVVMV